MGGGVVGCRPRRPTVGRISTHGAEPAAVLEPSAALHVLEPAAAHAATATRAYTHAGTQTRIQTCTQHPNVAFQTKSICFNYNYNRFFVS